MREAIVSYRKPSEASIYYCDLDQFVNVEIRSGGVVDYSAQAIVWEIVVDAWKAEQDLEDQYLKLRRVWVDDVHGSVGIYVQLLHPLNEEPKLTHEQILEIFHDGLGWYHGQGIGVEAIITTYRRGDDRFNSISDEYYEESIFNT